MFHLLNVLFTIVFILPLITTLLYSFRSSQPATIHCVCYPVAEIQVGRGGKNRHSLSEILGSVGILKQLNVRN